MTANRVELPAAVGIVGLGVIGGSIARDLAALSVRIIAHDRDAESLAQARAEGIVHDTIDDSLEGMDQAELVIVAVPIAATREVLEKLAPIDGAILTDVGSTKRGIVEQARRLKIDHRFVGAHPLAGDHRSGWTHARRGLFADATTYLCPTSATEAEPLSSVRRLWAALGARTVELDAAEHDRLLAYSSHLPHVAASAIALALARANVRVTDLGPGGRDVTRIAGASPDMWTSIALENREALLQAVTSLQSQLDLLLAGLRTGDADAVREVFAEARAWTLGGAAPR